MRVIDPSSSFKDPPSSRRVFRDSYGILTGFLWDSFRMFIGLIVDL